MCLNCTTQLDMMYTLLYPMHTCTHAHIHVYVHHSSSLLRSVGDHLLPNGATNQHQACDAVCVLCHNDAQPLNFVQTPNGSSTSTYIHVYTCILLVLIHVYTVIT